MTGNSTNENNAMKSGIPSLNLPADAGLPASGTTPAAGLQAVLDNLDALVYVSDFQTHELLYMNAYGRLVRLEIATDITRRKQMELELQEAHQQARAAALEDELTGLHNRRAFYEFGGQLLRHAKRHASPLAMVMMDLDYFKQVNDTYGHDAGDEVLRQIARLLQNRVRESDIVARLGGEEFALQLPDTTIGEAIELTERMLEMLNELVIQHKGRSIHASASFGITRLIVGDQTLEDLMHRADRALYQSKDQGRGRVSTCPD